MSYYIKSWEGLEELRSQIEQVAREVQQSDAAVRSRHRSSVATGLICEAMNDAFSQEDPLVLRAAQAQNELQRIHCKAVWEYGLDFDFVRAVWAPILDPR